MASNNLTCKQCLHWQFPALPDNKYAGRCRRNPPQLIRENGVGFWPITADIDYCGEFELFIEPEQTT